MTRPSASAVGTPPRSIVRDGVSCAEEFREDEQLLREGTPAVRVAVLAGLTVSYGVGVREDAPYLRRAREAGVATVRRTSGGTGVVHAPGDLAWSVVLPRAHPRVGSDFVRSYDRLGAGVVRFLHQHGVAGAWIEPPDLSADYCVLSGRGRVLTARSRVLGGAAQHLTRSALLHQGMIPRTVDPGLVARVFQITDPHVLARLVGWTELGIDTPAAALAQELAAELTRDLGGDPD
jgi:lipoate-protein ligase A